MLKEKEMLILSNLRNNARIKLTKISRNTRIPVSTIFEKIRNYENKIIRKHSCLINFNKIGYDVCANILLKVEAEEREKLRDFLLKRANLNSVFRISNGYDFQVEGIFKNMQELQDFIDELENNFTIIRNDIHHILNDLKREDFLSKKEHFFGEKHGM